MKCVLETRCLERALLKLKPIWSDVEVNPNLKFVIMEASEAALSLRASDLIMTGNVEIPLYQRCTSPGAVAVVGRDLLEIVRVAGNLVTLSVDENFACEIETSGYTWALEGREKFLLGDAFRQPDGPEKPPVRVDRATLLAGIEICEICVSDDASRADRHGIGFFPAEIKSTDAKLISVYRKGTDGPAFTLPKLIIPALKAQLDRADVDAVELRATPAQVEVKAGTDTLLFGQMGSFINIDAVTQQLDNYKPVFMVDRDQFLMALKRSGTRRTDKTSVTLFRAGEVLGFRTSDGVKVVGEGEIRVTWKDAEEQFSIKVDWGLTSQALRMLGSNIVDFGVGTFRGREFVRFDEGDRTIFVIEMPV